MATPDDDDTFWEVPNTRDPQQRRREEIAAMWRWLMSGRKGRAFFRWLMELTDPDSAAFTANATTTAYQLGMQHIGQLLRRNAQQHAFDQYQESEREGRTSE